MIVLASGETATQGNSGLFLYGLVLFFLMFFLIRAAMSYSSYKRSIFPFIYNNYLMDYFWNLFIRQNVSRSGKLNKIIGEHRIVYSNILNREGEIINRLMVIIHTKGIIVVSHLDPLGEVHGSDTGSWYVKRENNDTSKNYKIDNPVTHLREYDHRIKSLTGERDTDKIIAIAAGSDISHVHCSIPVVHYEEICDLIKDSDCGYGLNPQEIDEIFEKLGGKK